MNAPSRDAVIAVCVTAVIIAAMVITHSAAPLWLLVLLLVVAF